jgi:IS30 family transposase
VKNKAADLVLNAIIDRLKPLARRSRTLTYDNTKVLTHTHSSWQRLSSAKLNGLIRQYIPKSCPRLTVIDAELAKIEGLFNN